MVFGKFPRLRLKFPRLSCSIVSLLYGYSSLSLIFLVGQVGQPALALSPLGQPIAQTPHEQWDGASDPLQQPFPAPAQLPYKIPNKALQPSDAFTSYRLGPGDSLFVNVLRFPDLTFQNTIDLEGNMIIPLVGAMTLEGLTLAEAREQIRLALNRYVVEPQVDVILVAQRPVQVTILGEIVRPGLYPLAAPQLSTALVSAGGATSLADLRAVRVRRAQPDGTIAEKEVDLFTALETATPVPDLQLADGDTIVVPPLTSNQGYDRDLAARSTLAQPQINIRVLNYAAGSRGGGSFAVVQVPNGSSFLDVLAVSALDLSSADLHNVALIRFDPQQGKAITQELDGKLAIRGDASQNPILAQNDVIVVGRNLVARVTYALNTFTQPFRDILGFILFFQSLADSASNLFQPSGSSN